MTYIHKGLYWVSGKSPMPRPHELSRDIFSTFKANRLPRSIMLPSRHSRDRKSFPYSTSYTVYTFNDLPYWSFWQPPHHYSTFALSVSPIPMYFIIGEIINATYLSVDAQAGRKLIHAQKQYIQGLIQISEFINLPLILICLETEYEPTSIENILGQNIPSNVHTLIYTRDKIPNFLNDMAQILEITTPSNHHENTKEVNTQVWSIPNLPNITISPEYIGVGEKIADNYVREISQKLISQSIPFTVWVDIAETPPIARNEKELKLVNESLKWEVLYDGISIASPQIIRSELPGPKAFYPAYHTYVQVGTTVYDCFKAFNGIPLTIYQSKINGIKRDKIEIDLTLSSSTYVLSKIEHFLQRIYRISY
ncbi:MAG: hypothetical protein IT321_28185 [Anaerolineae bacterium]|nr:hypothetical protein [Anaerolineae bacterium]